MARLMQSDVQELIERHKKITVKDLPNDYLEEHELSMPLVSDKSEKFACGRGKFYERPPTIEDDNGRKKDSDGNPIQGTGLYYYAWATEKDMRENPFFSRGFTLVTEGSELARGVEGGRQILPRYFKNGIIQRGDLFLVAAKMTYVDKHKSMHRNMRLPSSLAGALEDQKGSPIPMEEGSVTMGSFSSGGKRR